MSLLTVEGLDAGYGADFQALYGVDLEINRGELFALVGANGAGKSTLLGSIAGSIQARSGAVRFADEDVTRLSDFERARRGILMVPEGRRLWPTMTVEENLLVGASTRRKGRWDLDAVYELLPLVKDRRSRTASHLSGGEQQAVAIGRALMGNPELLLVDELSLGLAPIVVDQLYQALPGIRDAGLTVILVEQDLSRTLAVADRIACMLEGRIVLRGAASELSRSAITDAYFGHGYAGLAQEEGLQA